MNTVLAKRRKFFDNQRENISAKSVRFSCPCCGYPTLAERGGYDICHICWWEDDGQDDSEADNIWGGPNHHYSLTDARKNFEKYLVMYPPEKDTRIGGADSKKVIGLKQNLIAIFDKMIEEPSSGKLSDLWKEVEKIEKVLRQDLKDSIEQYEANIKAEDSKEI